MLQLPAVLSCPLAVLLGRGGAAEAERVAAVHAEKVRDFASGCCVLSGCIIKDFSHKARLGTKFMTDKTARVVPALVLAVGKPRLA